ncbi:MAG TPA: hypothetical protein VK858_08520 [Longimicrobiales bacterium]|nr:hypothetical protein [Longimicrobiales bacterium]
MSSADLEAKLQAIERLNQMFRFERLVHLGVTLTSLAILLGSAGVMLWRQSASPAELAGLFGSSGAITYSAGRLLRMWSDALGVLVGKAPGADT